MGAAGSEYPARFGDRAVLPTAGRSLLPDFQAQPRTAPRTLYWATSGSQAIREGDWKLVAYKDGPWELYNLATDRTELTDLAKQEPARAAEMARGLETWQKQ